MDLFRGSTFKSCPAGGGFFREIEISPRLIKIAIASRMSSSNLSSFLWPVPPPIRIAYSIMRSTHKEMHEPKVQIIMVNAGGLKKEKELAQCEATR